MGALAFVLAALQAVPAIVAAGADVVAFVQQTTTSVTALQTASREPTAAEWAAQSAALRGTLDAG